MSVSWASAGVSVRPQLAADEHVRAVGEGDRVERALLDEQDRDAALADPAQRLEDAVDGERRQAERRLVEEQHVRLGHQRAADRELLLLAAREVARVAAAELLQDREEVVGDLERVAAAVPAPGREPEAEVLLDREPGEDPPALRHERHAGVRDRLGALPPQRAAAQPDLAGRRRHDAHDRVQRGRLARAVRADQADDLALVDAQPHVAHGGDAAVAHLDAVELEDRLRHRRCGRRSRPGRRPRRRGCARISSGAPAASVRPWSSTWIQSQTPITSAMLWSIRRTPVACSSRSERTTSANSGTSASGRPAAGSSISTNDGSVASTRATPSRRSSPCESAAACVSATGARLEELEQPVGAAARLARAGADAERRHLDVLPHGQAAERAAVLERAREPGPGAARRAPAGDLAARELDGALVRPVEPGQHVHERRLARAVRADQADDLVLPHLERDVAERVHALEGARDGGGPERLSGPPLYVRGECRLGHARR